MTLITKLSNERLDEIMQIRKATGATSTVQVLESNELESYMVNLNDAIKRQDDKMNRYKEGGAMYTCSQELKEQLLVIKAELIARMESEKAKAEQAPKAKKQKLTPTQQTIVDGFENAIYCYKLRKGDDSHGINIHTYIDGKMYGGIEWNGSTCYNGNNTYIINGNTFSKELKTNTITALAKKGIIDLEKSEIRGQGRDNLVTVETYNFEKPYEQFTCLKLEETSYCDFLKRVHTSTTTIYCPIGQEEQAMENFKEWTIVESSVVEVETEKFDY